MRHDLSRQLRVLVLITASSVAQQTNTAATSPPRVEETIIVTGTYEASPLKASDRTVEVIDIGKAPLLFPSWADALRLDSSVDLEQRAPGTQADLSIRGSSFGQNLVLVDGIRINDAQSDHHDLDLPIPFAAVQRVEVLHGSGSTLYGADAVGGAVNFITASPVASELRLAEAAGSFGSNSQNGNANYLARSWSQAVGFTREASSGFAPDRDYRNFAASSETRLTTSLGASDLLLGLSDRPFGAAGFYGDFNSWERTKGWFIAASQPVGESVGFAFGYRRHTDEFILLRDHPEVYENNHATESWQGALRARYKISENSRLFYGGEAFSDSIASNNLGQHSRNRAAIFADFDARVLGRWSLSAGARQEFSSGSGAVFTPELSAGYGIGSHLRFKASASKAFRLPSYTDLFYSDPANRGNPNLRPETAWGYEAGLDWNSGSRVEVGATLFHRRERDVIDYVRSASDPVWQAENIDRLDFTGIETQVRARVTPAEELSFGYTWLYGAERGTAGVESRYAFRYPVNQATGNWLGILPGRLIFRLHGQITERYGVDPYPLAEISLARQFSRICPYVEIANLANTGYEEIEGVRMPGRTFMAGVEIRIFAKGRRSPADKSASESRPSGNSSPWRDPTL